MRTEIKTVTPEMAKEMLKYNTVNRPIKWTYVAKYAESMRNGQWKFTGQSIQISEFGNVIDGQHRLNALIKADVSLPFLICYEVREEYFEVLDQGAARTAQDVLATKGVANYTNVAAAIKRCIIMQRMANPSTAPFNQGGSGGISNSYGGKSVTNTDVFRFYNEHPEISQRAHKLCDIGYNKFKLLTKSLLTAMYLFLVIHMKHKEEDVERFIKELTGVTNTNIDAIILLRQKLINASASKTYQLDTKALNAMLTIAWQDYITGRYKRQSFNINPDKEYTFA